MTRPMHSPRSQSSGRLAPLTPLAREAGQAVALALQERKARRVMRTAAMATTDVEQLGQLIATLIDDALHRSLAATTAEGKALRLALIADLALTEAGQTGAAVTQSAPDEPSTARTAQVDEWLTTAGAARQLDVSRPYVSMLCDQGKLGEVVVTEGGHRRIRACAVAAYLAERTQRHIDSPSPREAAIEADLYDHPDSHYTNVVRRTNATAKATQAAAAKPHKRRP